MAFCGNCGNKVEDNVKVCPSCGNVINTTATPAEPVQPPVEPQPQQVYEQPVQPEPTAEEKLQQATTAVDNFAQKLGNTADSTAQFSKEDIEQNKVMSVLAYFGFLVIVPIVAAKNSPFARFHSNQGLVLFLGMIAWIIADSIASAILRAILWKGLGLWSIYSLCTTVLDICYLVFTILAIIGIINALNGRAKDLPLIGKFRILK